MLRMYVPVLACAVLAFAGCGDDDDASSGGQPSATGTPLTKAQYVAQANEICSDTQDDQKQFDDRLDDIDRGDLASAAPVLEDAIKSTRAGYDKLRALPPPTADKARVDDYNAAVSKLLDSRDKLTKAARDNDRPAGQAAAAEGDKLDDAQKRLGEALGLDDCANIF